MEYKDMQLYSEIINKILDRLKLAEKYHEEISITGIIEVLKALEIWAGDILDETFLQMREAEKKYRTRLMTMKRNYEVSEGEQYKTYNNYI